MITEPLSIYLLSAIPGTAIGLLLLTGITKMYGGSIFLAPPIVIDYNIPLIIKSWREISDTIGRDVKIETISGSLAGLAVEISKDGSLLIQTKDGKKERIIAGDCIYLDQGHD